MLLTKLTVENGSKVLREISFRKGLNLVIDETINASTKSGNSVGKTTVLRVIDFCFGSDGRDIYEDKEFGSTNETVYNFLVDNDVHIILEIEKHNKRILIERGFAEKSTLRINGEDFNSIASFREGLQKDVLDMAVLKPSLRQIMAKFIRKDTHSMSNTIKFLYPSTGREDYEALFLFLFGFEDQRLLYQKLLISRELKHERSKRRSLIKDTSLTTLKQLVKITENEIEVAKQRLKSFQVDEAYENYLTILKDVKQKISKVSVQISELNLRKSLNENTVNELINNLFSGDIQTITEIYNEAKELLPSIGKTFEQMVAFHNQMVQKKIDFVNNNLSHIDKSLSEREDELRLLLKQEKELFSVLTEKGSLSDLEIIHLELNQLYEKLGSQKNMITLIDESDQKIKRLVSTEHLLSEKVQSYIEDFEGKIGRFNSYFSDYSKKLYDEKYILTFDSTDGKINFKIINIEGNVGGGKKKAQIAAFDLAYISFLQDMKSELCRFILHDAIEDVHVNQIKTLFDIADSIEGQYVVATLKNSITFLGESFINEHKIVSLSQDDKFFRI